MLHWLEILCAGIVKVTGILVITAIEVGRQVGKAVKQLQKNSSLQQMLASLKEYYAEPIKENVTVDLYEAQLEMEKQFDKNQTHKRISAEYAASELNFRQIFIDNGLEPKFGYDLLVAMQLHKRANLPTLVGQLRKHFGGDCQATADAILKAAECDLIDYNVQWDVFIVRYALSGDVLDEIELYQYPLPMIIEPRELKNNRDTGYLTRKDSVILKNNHHDDDVCLDTLNKFNRTKLRVNSDTVAFMRNSWKNLDKQKDGETREDFLKRRRAFEKYDQTSRDVLAHLEIAGGEFYLTHKYDKRGRIYCQGYHVTYQGNTWNKACLEFAHGELLD